MTAPEEPVAQRAAASSCLAFSCQMRNFCPSVRARRAALVAETLLADVLAPVPHRRLIFTIPKVLRGRFLRERRLLSILARSAYQAVRAAWANGLEDRRAPPGLEIAIQTFGSCANWHPLPRARVTNGMLTLEDALGERPHGTPQVVEELPGRLVLKRPAYAEPLSEAFQAKRLGTCALEVCGARRPGGVAR